MNSPATGVQGFLAAGHVCTVTGYRDYMNFARKYKVPVVVTGFEPLDILQGIYMLICQLEEGRCEVENQYARSVREEGNLNAKAIIDEVFTVVDRRWRGIGVIPGSGLKLADNYRQYDAEYRFDIKARDEIEPEVCISGLILQGVKKPPECPAFAINCTPEHPLGATMVSSEGACAAYFRYKNHP
jgi:hydrogenase expression/formation protein HypD